MTISEKIVSRIKGKTKQKDHNDYSDYIEKVNLITCDLRQGFENFCQVYDPEKLTIAKTLIEQEGTVDLKIEGFKCAENQRDLSIKFHWGHDHRFNEELSVKGRMGERHIKLIAEFMAGFSIPEGHFEGKDVIDVGSWTGGTTLMLKHLGARNVLALEEVQKYARTTSKLVNDVYGLDGVTSDGTNLYDLKTSSKYDVAYFPGVIYHLSDPVLGLRRLFNCLKDGGECFVETAGLDSPESIARFEGNRIYHKTSGERASELTRGGWNWFSPSPLCLERWMVESGFEDVNCFYSHASDRVFGYGRRNKYVDICRAGFSVPSIE